MTAPSRRSATSTGATTTTSLTGISVTSGDLIVVLTTGGDSAPGATLTPTNCTLEDSTFVGGGGQDEDVRAADASDNFYAHIWSSKVTGTSGTATVDISVSNWSTGGGRRWHVVVMNPGTGRSWDVRANRLASTGTLSETSGSSPRHTSNWSPAPPSGPIAFALAGYKTSVAGSTYDPGDTGSNLVIPPDSGSSPGGGGAFFPALNATATQAKAADAYYDTGASDRPQTGHGVGLTVGAGGKAFAVALYQTSAGTTSQAIATAVETDTGTALGKTKSKTLGLATETDTASTLTTGITRAIGTASSTNTGIALGRTKSLTAGLAAETDSAFHLVTVAQAIGTATVTTTASALPWTKTATFEVALTSLGNGPFTSYTLAATAWAASGAGDVRLTLLNGSTAIQTGDWATLTSTPASYTLPITNPVTTFTALRGRVEVRTTSGVDFRLDYGPTVAAESVVGTALETYTVFPLGRNGARPIGTAVETSTAFPVRGSLRTVQIVKLRERTRVVLEESTTVAVAERSKLALRG